MTTVLVFGDSICAGSDLPDGGPADAWPVVWAAGHPAITLVNASRGGRPTSAFGEFEEALRRHGPADLLILALGTNDSRDPGSQVAATAVANLRRMAALARGLGILRIAILAPCNLDAGAIRQTGEARTARLANIEALERAYARLAAEDGLLFLSLLGAVPAGSMARDGVHPDRAGNLAIAARFDHWWQGSAGPGIKA